MDLSKIMQMAGQMQEQMKAAQEKLASAEHQGEAGGGLVKVTMNGRHEMLRLDIDPSLKDDLELMADLIRAATNAANRKVADSLQGQLGGMAQGMGIDPDMLKKLGLG